MDRPRRAVLGGLAGLAVVTPLAGCGAPRQGGDPRQLEIVSTDSRPELPVRPAVAVVRDAGTSEHPPRIRTSLANESDQTVIVGEGRAVHFEYVTDTDGELILLPAGPDRTYPALAGCWRLTEPIAITEEYRTFPIESGTTSLRHVDLYATPEGDGCLPAGEYRLETTISILDDGEESRSETWGFSVVLSTL